jgi:hypothetical protein
MLARELSKKPVRDRHASLPADPAAVPRVFLNTSVRGYTAALAGSGKKKSRWGSNANTTARTTTRGIHREIHARDG